MHINTEFDGQFIINSYNDHEIVVNHNTHTHSFIITPVQIISPWQAQSIERLNAAHLEQLLIDNPSVCLLGVGETHQTLPTNLLASFIKQGIALEAMTTPAACRTYNILATEGRRVSVGFLL